MFSKMKVSIALMTVGLVASAMASSAAQSDNLKTKIVESVANTLVNDVESDSCDQFAEMLARAKNRNKPASNSSGAMIKNDPASRERFVNIVAGPLLNKMIDCNLLPTR